MYRKSAAERVFIIFNTVFLLLLSAAMLYPLLNVFAISLNQGLDTSINSSFIWPRKFTLENYVIAFNFPNIQMAIFISFARTVLGTLLHLLVCSLAAYALSKPDLVFKKFIVTVLLLPGIINPGLVPVFLNFHYLHLTNNFLIYILPYCFSFTNILIIRTYIQGLPNDMAESAIIDGAGYMKIFFSIIFPLAIPTIAAIGLFTAVWQWNDWYTTMVYISNPKLFTLQYLLQRVIREVTTLQNLMSSAQYSQSELASRRDQTFTELSLRMAILMISTLPIIFVYPFVQRYFAKGMLIGAVKE